MEDLYRFWAKSLPEKSLVHHMIDVGSIANALLTDSSMCTAGDLINGYFSGIDVTNEIIGISALHDLGKCHPSFQGKANEIPFIIELQKRGKISISVDTDYRHEVGTKIILERIFEIRNLDLSKNIKKMIQTLLRLHHQKAGNNYRRIKSCNDVKYWEEMQNNLFDFICKIFNVDFNRLSVCNDHDGAAVLIWGVTVIADWLASGQEEFFGIDRNLSDMEYKRESEKAASVVIKRCGFQKNEVISAKELSEMFTFITDETIRPVQRKCAEIVKEWDNFEKIPGLIIIEAPMGEGKTEAALFLAVNLLKQFGKIGFYVALPTAATSNQMYERINEFLNGQKISSLRLLHSMAWMIDDEVQKNKMNLLDNESDYRNMESWLAPLRRGLLSQYAVGTVDQVLMSIMRIRNGILRTVGIASKVIVIDEVHAYDTYMYSIIERLLNWCATLKIPVVLLSATLPEERRISIIKAYGGDCSRQPISIYPLITTVTKEGPTKEYEVAETYMKSHVFIEKLPILGDWAVLADLAIDQVREGGCLCIIMNTVVEAQNFYSELRTRTDNSDIKIILFHARFPAGERQIIEEECLNLFGKKSLFFKENKDYHARPKKAILVATQVVEQSLDLDFDVMMSAIAPIDLLLQRMGRLHRHSGRKRSNKHKYPLFIVLTPCNSNAFKPTEAVYNKWILMKTLEAIAGKSGINLPVDIRCLVDSVYEAVPESGSEDEYNTWAEKTFRDDLNSEKAKRVIFPIPNKDSFFSNYVGDFFDEDSGDMTASEAFTRLGEPQLRFAIVTPSETEGAHNPSKEMAKRILNRSFSIRAKDFHGVKPHDEYEKFIDGGGLLYGVTLIPSKNNQYSFNKSNKTITLIADKQLGIIKKEE